MGFETIEINQVSSFIKGFDLVFETILWSFELLNIDRQGRDKVSQRTLIHPTIAKLSPAKQSWAEVSLIITLDDRPASQKKYILRKLKGLVNWNCSAWSRPKLKTKIGLHTTTHYPPQELFWRVLDMLGGKNLVCSLPCFLGLVYVFSLWSSHPGVASFGCLGTFFSVSLSTLNLSSMNALNISSTCFSFD